VRMTELWVEAEAFGAQIDIPENAFPIIKSKVIPDIEDIGSVNVPDMTVGRLSVLVEAIKKTRDQLPDALLFAGVTGAFSLGGCLTDAEELMMGCYTDPEAVHAFMEKLTTFLIRYCSEYKAAGASGVFIAEPSISMLSPEMAEEFSHKYLKRIVAEVQSDDFAVVYHNCGDVTLHLQDIKGLGAMAYHFGDAISMQTILELFPNDVPILGNIHPAKFAAGNEAALATAIKAMKEQYGGFPNFVLSSGCDIAPSASIESLQRGSDTSEKTIVTF